MYFSTSDQALVFGRVQCNSHIYRLKKDEGAGNPQQVDGFEPEHSGQRNIKIKKISPPYKVKTSPLSPENKRLSV